MATKSARANTQISAEMIQALLNKVDIQSKQIASLMTTAPKAAGPNAKGNIKWRDLPAQTAPEFKLEMTESRGGPAVKMSFNGGMARFLYVSELRILAKHWNELNAAISKIK